jgi:hypothetical protein
MRQAVLMGKETPTKGSVATFETEDNFEDLSSDIDEGSVDERSAEIQPLVTNALMH